MKHTEKNISLVMKHIKIGDLEVTFKDIRNLHLSVHPPLGKVTISSPEYYDLEKVRVYAATKFFWIKKEQRKFQTQDREPKRDYLNQESHYFSGTRYLLKIEEAKRNSVSLKGKKIIIYTTNSLDKIYLEKLLYAFYRKELRKTLNHMLERQIKIMGLELPPFKIRYMKNEMGQLCC